MFLSRCQFKYGGIAKAPSENPGIQLFSTQSTMYADLNFADPYHTYLSLAALSMYPPEASATGEYSASWNFAPIDPLLNAREETALWIRQHIPATRI
jgi:geranylgeranyl transferase type-1 subunit beta